MADLPSQDCNMLRYFYSSFQYLSTHHVDDVYEAIHYDFLAASWSTLIRRYCSAAAETGFPESIVCSSTPPSATPLENKKEHEIMKDRRN
jgi:hypothetical protein